jgi:hypothetical protein
MLFYEPILPFKASKSICAKVLETDITVEYYFGCIKLNAQITE